MFSAVFCKEWAQIWNQSFILTNISEQQVGVNEQTKSLCEKINCILYMRLITSQGQRGHLR